MHKSHTSDQIINGRVMYSWFTLKMLSYTHGIVGFVSPATSPSVKGNDLKLAAK